MTEMFSLLKELTKSKSPEKVLVREEVRSPITKYMNAISLVRVKNDKGKKSDMVVDKNILEPLELVDKEDAMDEKKVNKSNGKDELIDVAGFVYPINFIMLDIKEDECMPLISGTPFLTTAKAAIKFDKGRMTIMAGNYKIRFVRTLEHPSKIEERIKGDLEPIILTNHVKIRILEWEKRINNHQEKEMGLNKWRSKVFDDKQQL
ncbi:hypothetical protein Tco_0206730 [Tanacetum coccineum]